MYRVSKHAARGTTDHTCPWHCFVLLYHGLSAAGSAPRPFTPELSFVQAENTGQGAQQSAWHKEGTGKCNKEHAVHMARKRFTVSYMSAGSDLLNRHQKWEAELAQELEKQRTHRNNQDSHIRAYRS